MYKTNAYIRLREHNRVLEVVETYDEVKALIDAAVGDGTAPAKKHIEVTVTRVDTQYLSPTPVNTVPEKKEVTVKNLVLVDNIVLVQPVVAAPSTF
jgi:hypothetical protein